MIKDLITKSRTYRRFYEDEVISSDVLKELVEIARLTPSGANLQPLKYVVVSDPEKREEIFPHLAWAGYLKEWMGPAEGERPTGYIIVFGDSSISKNFGTDLGIASQSIMLGAYEMGFGGCMIASFNKVKVKDILEIPEGLEVLLVLALGKPKEEVVIEEVENGDIKYWRDSNEVHHVPKRPLNEILIKKL